MSNNGATFPDFLMFLVLALLVVSVAWGVGYKSGQIDALNGDASYEKVITNKTTWELKSSD